MPHIGLGAYGIEIRAINAVPTSYNLMETAFAPDGTQIWSQEVADVVAPGSVDQYAMTYALPEPATRSLLACQRSIGCL